MKIDQAFYTSCPSNKGRAGYDGFQVKACSRGVTREIEDEVRRVSERYAWPTSLDSMVRPGELSKEDFAKFPVALHYYRLTDGRYALTRISIKPFQPQRAGDFFAHTLIFAVEALADASWNPFAVARSGIFKYEDESSEIQLPEIDSLPSEEGNTTLNSVLSTMYLDRLPVLIDALSTNPNELPLIIVPAELKDAWQLIETVLLMLPGKYRAQVEFSVYEPDPYRLMRGGTDQPAVGRRLFTTSLPAEGGRFQFRPGEYESRFRIFNFAESKYSQLDEPSDFAKRMADLYAKGRHEEIAGYHEYMVLLKLDTDPKTWNVALITRDYFSKTTGDGRPELREVVDSLMGACLSQERAQAASATLACLLTEYYQKHNDNEFQMVCQALKTMLGRVEDAKLPRRDAGEKLAEVVSQLLLSGYVARASEIVDAVGSIVAIKLGDAVKRVVTSYSDRPEVMRQFSPSDISALPDLLDKGLFSLLEKPSEKQSLKVILPEALQYANKTGCLKPLWKKLSLWLMSEWLDKLPGDECAELSNRIREAIKGEQYASVQLEFLLWQLRSDTMPKETRLSLIPSLASACRASDNPTAAANATLSEAKERFEKSYYISLLEDLAGTDDSNLSHVAWGAYTELMNKLSEQEQWAVRKSLAARQGRYFLLYSDFRKSVWPWANDQTGREELGEWMRRVFASYSRASDVVAEQLVAVASEKADERPMAQRMLGAYLEQLTVNHIDRDGKGARSIVARQFINMISLEEVTLDVTQYLDNIETGSWSKCERAKQKLFIEVASVRKLYDEKHFDTSFAKLLEDHKDLANVLTSPDIETRVREQGLRWAVVTALKDAGIEDPGSAQVLFKIITQTEQNTVGAQVLSDAISRVNPVKSVVSLTQFFLLAQVSQGPVRESVLTVVKYVVEQLKKDTQKLLVQYLDERRSDKSWQDFIHSQDFIAEMLGHPDKPLRTDKPQQFKTLFDSFRGWFSRVHKQENIVQSGPSEQRSVGKQRESPGLKHKKKSNAKKKK